MAKRLKVLISAYACEPGTGSEPEAGWQWALQMAQHQDVQVLTRTNNRPRIEARLEELAGTQPLPRFHYHDCSPPWLAFKRRFKAVKVYYLRWQQTAREVVRQLHKAEQFDLLHHVTFAAYRYPVAILGHNVASIWGPIGGIESIPLPLLPWKHPLPLAQELLRNADNTLQTSLPSAFPKRARASTFVIASTRKMQEVLARLRLRSELAPTIGLEPGDFPLPSRGQLAGPLRLLYVGNLIPLKGLDLALVALRQSETAARLTLIGSGTFEQNLRHLAARLGLGQQVNFTGRVPREQVLRQYADYDVLVFPSLHDTGGYAVIEAMANELPVICLDCGGPAVAVDAGCGAKVGLGSRAKVISGLTEAIQRYDCDRDAVVRDGKAARASALRNYSWIRKAEQMNQWYQDTVQRFRPATVTR